MMGGFMNRRLLASLTILLLCAVGGSLAYGHSGAAGIVKTRMEAMKDIASHMKVLAFMVEEKVAFDSEIATRSANAIADHAQNMEKLFPAGSNAHPSEAAPIIWEDWEAFSNLTAKLEESASNMSQTMTDGVPVELLTSEFQELASVCKACHKKFRLTLPD